MWRRALVGIVLLANVWARGPHPSAAQSGPGSLAALEHDGLTRTYSTYVPPSYDGGEAVPLVIALHPFASSGRALEALTGLDALADQYGFIVVYPNSAAFAWDDGRSARGWLDGAPPVDDVGYIGALIDELAATYRINGEQVYLAGYGNGGLMAYRLACDLPERFAKVAVVGAGLWDYHLDGCAPDAAPPPSMLILVGDQDPYYPAEGREVGSGDEEMTVLPLDDTVNFWRDRNRCNADPATAVEEPEIRVYVGCAGNATVAFYRMPDVSSNWPRTGAYTLNQAGIDAAAIIGAFFAGDETWIEQITAPPAAHSLWSGKSRGYTVYVPPSYDPAQPAPLVIALHGRPDTGSGIAYLLDMNPVADEHGFIVAYPDGLNREWNYVKGFAGWDYTNTDDVGFLSALADDLSRDFNLDPARMYVTGFSNGGFMTQRVACDAPEKFAAFGVIGASLFPGFVDVCENTLPVPILFMHGTKDQSIAWEGTAYSDGTVISLSVPDTVLFWAVHNECDPKLTEDEVLPMQDPNAITQVYKYTFGGCKDGSDIEFYAIEGGGHTLPGVQRLNEEFFGATNMDIKAAEVIWEFFARHPKTD